MKTQKEETKKLGGKGKKMNRKEAISKAGFITISAATTMMLLSVPKAAHASTAPAAPTTPSGGGEWIRRTAP